MFSDERAAQHGISISIMPPGQLPAPLGSGSHERCVNMCSVCTRCCILFSDRYGAGWKGERVDLVIWKLGSYSRYKLAKEATSWRPHRWDGTGSLGSCGARAVPAAACVLLPCSFPAATDRHLVTWHHAVGQALCSRPHASVLFRAGQFVDSIK